MSKIKDTTITDGWHDVDWSKINAPQRPKYQAKWTPVFIEPIIKSGESICIGIAAIGDDGKIETACALSEDALHGAFGKNADSLMNSSRAALQMFQDFLEKGGWLTHWIPPFSGMRTGGVRIAAANDMTGILRQAMMMSACFSALLLDPSKSDISRSAKEQKEDRWPVQVKQAVIKQMPQLSMAFDKSFQAIQGARKTPIDFIGVNMAAGFSKIIPTGQQLSRCINDAKARLWNLHTLRDNPDLFPLAHYELILYRPNDSDPSYTDRQINALHEAILELTNEGDKHELRVFPVTTANQAAERIIGNEKAA